jgi:ABC-type glycerol-3-phosphate transport system permease component
LTSDFSSIAAGVTMTVIPILIFFVALQRQFIRDVTSAAKGQGQHHLTGRWKRP